MICLEKELESVPLHNKKALGVSHTISSMRILSLLACFILILPGSLNLHLSQESLGESVNWFHVNAGIFKIKYVLPLNMSSNTNITMDVCVPGNDTFQKVLATDYDPCPNLTFTDGAGLNRVRYELATTTPKFLNITVHYTVLILFSSLVVDFSQKQNVEDIPMEIREKYTKPDPYIESDDLAILGNATKLTRDAADINSKIDTLFDFVSNRQLFEYDDSVQNITRNPVGHVRGALWALQNRRGVCFDFACLFVALLRAAGVPSRISEGVILDGRSGFIVHDWAEVYLPGFGWTPYDPTWKEPRCNLHMKILNPSYDQITRWNYSVQSGSLHNFPEDSPYAVNDQVYIENRTSPDLVDSMVLVEDSCLNLTRMLRFNNEFISSSICVSNVTQRIDNFYGILEVNLSKNTAGVKTIDYFVDFQSYHLESLQVNVLASWCLVFSGSIMPSLGSASRRFTSEPLQFVLVEPLLWIGNVLFLSALFVALILLVRRRKTRGIARWLVPKMVKNGLNSVLQTSAGSRRLVAASIFV
jgi:hypothetical protein